MANHIYEACVILRPGLSEPEIEAQLDRLKAPLIEGGAAFRAEARWGVRRLAYNIEKYNEGYYVVMFFTLARPGETIINFERRCRYEDNVLRVMTIKVPARKKGQEIKPIIPAPGFLADFSIRWRPAGGRRRSERGGRGRREEAPPAEGPAREEESRGEPAKEGVDVEAT